MNLTIMMNASSNTTARFQPPNTIYIGWLYLFLNVFSYISNIFFITLYCKSPQLHTPFSVYVLTLAITDLVKSCTSNFSQISNFMEIPWILGEGFCNLCLYLTQALAGFVLHVHVLISCNRFWAVTFPNSYRLYHTTKFAAGVVLLTAVYINAWSLPGVIVFDQRSRAPYNARFCVYFPSGPNQQLYAGITTAFVHWVPQCIVLLLYPFIAYKVLKVVRKKVHAQSWSRQGTGASRRSDAMELSKSLAKEDQPTGSATKTYESGSEKFSASRGPVPKRMLKSEGRHFLMLTILFLSVTISWTPSHIAYTWVIWNSYMDYRLISIGNYIFSLDCTMNPVLCLVSSKEWRQAARALWRRNRTG
ncbi:5-hydroxytryptamine receptor 1B-like [Paramacrobiotus metropolitanus]|uniref:5-hydroxytryptamine receptor 1B-like n=1 Tax=Paramacrobiotus metropolitanus TaxID=2943436 RepID=UPI0024460862|nr:5-hydroxytryptamine receptor 1B-like [Paramacrobiotus metropolitanus]